MRSMHTRWLLSQQYRIAFVLALAAVLVFAFVSGRSCYVPFITAYTSPDVAPRGVEVMGQAGQPSTPTPVPTPVQTPEAPVATSTPETPTPEPAPTPETPVATSTPVAPTPEPAPTPEASVATSTPIATSTPTPVVEPLFFPFAISRMVLERPGDIGYTRLPKAEGGEGEFTYTLTGAAAWAVLRRGDAHPVGGCGGG